MPHIEVSILIVSWNVKDYVLACLTSVAKHTTGLRHEIILIDNNSSDGTTEIVTDRFPHVHVIKNKTNAGFAAANNLGLKAAHGRYLILLNPDTELTENSFRRMVDFFENRPEIGALGCKLVNAAGEIDYQCAKRMPTIANHALSMWEGAGLWRDANGM
jgi:GT2 family glycosyltransferase